MIFQMASTSAYDERMDRKSSSSHFVVHPIETHGDLYGTGQK